MPTYTDQYEFDDMSGNHIEMVVHKDGHDRWKVMCWQNDDCHWERDRNPDLGPNNPRSGMPFTREEALEEFERWRPK